MGQAQTTSAPDGRILCYAEFGDLGGHPVLSLHGTPGCRLLSARSVDLDLEGLLRSSHVRLIRYDRPGYGGSDRHQGRSVADSAEDVEAVADALGLGRFALEGSSGGAPHALAAAALLPERVERVALVAPLAPYDRLGADEWTRGQDPETQRYLQVCLKGEEAMLDEFAVEDAQMHEAAAADETQLAVFEATRKGLWGWVDDEASALRDWGFAVSAVRQRARIWYDPSETVLPPQHPQWLARELPYADLVTSEALGHGSKGDPRPDWHALYEWLAG